MHHTGSTGKFGARAEIRNVPKGKTGVNAVQVVDLSKEINQHDYFKAAPNEPKKNHDS